MIVRFSDRALEDFWHGKSSARARRIPADIRTRLMDRLTQMDAAAALSDLAVPPSNNLEALSGDLDGWWSIRVNKQWRLIFKWTDAGPAEVYLSEHYHPWSAMK